MISKSHNIPFNRPFFIGNEIKYIKNAIASGKISGDGIFSQKCHSWFEKKYGFKKAFLTPSCTDALEMCAILLNIQPEDEVIMPSFTFVSTANAFVLRGSKIVFADSENITPNIDANRLEPLISKRTKAIVVVHYAGIACDMGKINALAKKHNLFVIEDAAHALDSFYQEKPLGSLGHLAAFSFHETKNIISGEGGLLAINSERFIKRAEIIREKGTNRSAFFRGETNKYGWIDIGSSFLPSEIIAAFLFAQIEKIEKIQKKRRKIWEMYYHNLQPLRESGKLILPTIPKYATQNGHIFYIICNNLKEREALIKSLKSQHIMAAFHYQSLHKSKFYREKHDGRKLVNADKYSDCLLRLPLFYELSFRETEKVIKVIEDFYHN